MVGFDARNKDMIDVRFHCLVCSLILQDPVQLVCGHRQCQSCVESIVGEVVKCSQCQEECRKQEVLVDRGCRNDMQIVSIECSLCNWAGLLKDYKSHLQETHPHPVCEFCNKIFDSTNTLHSHKLIECEKIIVPCALKEFGCSDAVVRVQMENHYMTEQHQNAIVTGVRRLILKWLNDYNKKSSSMEVDIPPHITTTMIPSDKDDSSIQLQEIYRMIDTLVGGIQAMNDDAQYLSSESLRYQIVIEELKHDITTLKLSIQEEDAFVNGLRPNQEILNQDIASLKQRVQDMQYVSYDGMFVWKITNFREKMADARSERQTSIYSPPFYSSPTGYKMRARLYLHGDGNARRTHMSLFFVLMRGDNDAILKFPFNYKVTFCLYDQTPAQRHIIDSFRPDIRSNSFQRPASDMNIASGIPKFFPLAMIEQEGNPYVRDDTIFIKIMVDFAELPKAILPYALSLDPGLPVYIQHRMIKLEMERRAQQTSTPGNSLVQSNEKHS